MWRASCLPRLFVCQKQKGRFGGTVSHVCNIEVDGRKVGHKVMVKLLQALSESVGSVCVAECEKD